MAGEIYNEVTNRLHSVRESEDPKTNHITTGADEVYDDIAPYRINGHIDCTAITPVGTENPVELRWYERVNYGTEQEPLYDWIRSQDITVDNQKTYGIPNGAKQSDINDQLYEMAGDTDKVVLYANEYEQITNPPAGSNPQANGWYELSGTTYVLTTDTTVVSGKTYYIRVAKITSNGDKIIGKEDGYIPTAGAVGRALGANFEDNLKSTSTVKGLTANQGRVLNEIKANKNGWYEQLVAGASLSLIGDEVDEKATFIERETGDSTATGGINHSVDKGTATIDTIYGNTIKFNQIIGNPYPGGSGLTIIKNSDGSITINGTSEVSWYASFLRKDKNIKNHVYYLANKVLSGSCSNGIYLTDGYSGPNLQLSNTSTAVIAIHTTTNASTSIGLNQVLNKTFNNYTTFIYQIDLTAIFGAGNEPSTVADVEAWLTQNVGYQDYYPYNAGSLISLKPKKLISTGVNLYNPTTETAKVLSGKQYKLTGTNTGAAYSDGTAITLSDSLFTASKDDTITISGGNSTSTFLYLVLNNDTSKTFEPYKTNEVDLSWIMDIPDPNDSSKKLFSYGLLSVSNVCDEVRKTLCKKRFKKIKFRDLTWSWYNSSVCRSNIVSDFKSGSDKYICSKFPSGGYSVTPSSYDTLYRAAGQFYLMPSTTYSSIDDFIAANGDCEIIYELATPIEVTFEEPDTHPMNYEVEDGGTEKLLPENTSTLTTSALVADIRYPLNALDAIRNIQNNFSTQGALYQTFITLCSALNSAITTGTFAVSPDETVVGKFNFTFTPSENTQSVEEPNETI